MCTRREANSKKVQTSLISDLSESLLIYRWLKLEGSDKAKDVKTRREKCLEFFSPDITGSICSENNDSQPLKERVIHA